MDVKKTLPASFASPNAPIGLIQEFSRLKTKVVHLMKKETEDLEVMNQEMKTEEEAFEVDFEEEQKVYRELTE